MSLKTIHQMIKNFLKNKIIKQFTFFRIYFLFTNMFIKSCNINHNYTVEFNESEINQLIESLELYLEKAEVAENDISFCEINNLIKKLVDKTHN